MLKLSVIRHPRALPLSDSESASILRTAQNIITESCREAWQSVCKFQVIQLDFRTATYRDSWVQTQPKAILTTEDIKNIAGRESSVSSHSGIVFLHVVRRIDECDYEPFSIEVPALGCTQGNSIFVALGSDSKALDSHANPTTTRDSRWFREQARTWAHEIGHAAHLSDLCADRFSKTLMFWMGSNTSTDLSLKECGTLGHYPNGWFDLDPDASCPSAKRRLLGPPKSSSLGR